VVPKLALAVQERTSFLLARVPAVPLSALVIANLLFAVLGVGHLRRGGQEDTSTAQHRRACCRSVRGTESPTGLRGRDMNKLYEENDGRGSMRVAIDRVVDGGYEYNVQSADKIRL